MSTKSKILRRNITLLGEDLEIIEALQKLLKKKFGVQKLSQAEVVRKALHKLAEIEFN